MGRYLRGRQTLWNGVQTGVAGASATGVIGDQQNVVLMINVNGATTIGIQVAPSMARSGLNELPASAEFYPLFKADGTAAETIVFAGSGSAAIDLSPFGAQYVRFTSTADVLATAKMQVIDS